MKSVCYYCDIDLPRDDDWQHWYGGSIVRCKGEPMDCAYCGKETTRPTKAGKTCRCERPHPETVNCWCDPNVLTITARMDSRHIGQTARFVIHREKA